MDIRKRVLEDRLKKHIDKLLERCHSLEVVKREIIQAYLLMEETFENGGKLLIAGNGGSAADAEHIVGELMKGFKLKRMPDQKFQEKLKLIDPVRGARLATDLQGGLAAISLNAHSALNSAYLNDVEGLECYAQQVYGYGKEGDVLLGISTSGNAKNIMYATVVARALNMKVIGFTGSGGGELGSAADTVVKVPAAETHVIQELQMPIYHCWCLMLEEKFYG